MSRNPIFLRFPVSQNPIYHIKSYDRDASYDCICFHHSKQMHGVKRAKARPHHSRLQLPGKLLAQVHQALHNQQPWCTRHAVYNNGRV